MSVFGEKIRDRREELRLSQEQLAKLSGLTRRSIVSYETTDKIPHGSSIRKLAAALGVTVRYLEHDEIDDPNAGIEEEPFIVTAASSPPPAISSGSIPPLRQARRKPVKSMPSSRRVRFSPSSPVSTALRSETEPGSPFSPF